MNMLPMTLMHRFLKKLLTAVLISVGFFLVSSPLGIIAPGVALSMSVIDIATASVACFVLVLQAASFFDKIISEEWAIQLRTHNSDDSPFGIVTSPDGLRTTSEEQAQHLEESGYIFVPIIARWTHQAFHRTESLTEDQQENPTVVIIARGNSFADRYFAFRQFLVGHNDGLFHSLIQRYIPLGMLAAIAIARFMVGVPIINLR